MPGNEHVFIRIILYYGSDMYRWKWFEHVKIVQWYSFQSKIKIPKGSLCCQLMTWPANGITGNRLKIVVAKKWKSENDNDADMCKSYCIRLHSNKSEHSVHA